ncbi:hypothetical protein DFJ74DRAFT_760297 [Hyaloraphidium curvatum]|nr:hypothetical protein DFJ74DRAFT_760297 [Hyaloraphidium curvatum]
MEPSPVHSLFTTCDDVPPVPLRVERPAGAAKEKRRRALPPLHGTLAFAAPGGFEVGRPGGRRVLFNHFLDGAAKVARLEFLGDTAVFSLEKGGSALERAIADGASWPAEQHFTFGTVDVSESASRASIAVDRPMPTADGPATRGPATRGPPERSYTAPPSAPPPRTVSVGAADPSPPPAANGKLVIQTRPLAGLPRSTSTPTLTTPAASRSLASYFWGAPSAPSSPPPAAQKQEPSPSVAGRHPSAFHCSHAALAAPLQPFLRSSPVSLLLFGTGGFAQAWDAERAFAAIPLDPNPPDARYHALPCPEPQLDARARTLYHVTLLLPSGTSWTPLGARSRARITRLDLADDMAPAVVAEFDHPASYPWCFALTPNYIVLFSGPSTCRLDTPTAPRRSFSFSRASAPPPEGFKPPPVLQFAFSPAPNTYTVVSRHTGQLLGRFPSPLPYGGLVREVVRAGERAGLLTLDLLVHDDLSAQECLSLSSLRGQDGYARPSPTRVLRTTIHPALGTVLETPLTAVPLSHFLSRGGGTYAVLHPPWLSPGPHAWEASSLVALDPEYEPRARLRPRRESTGERCVPAGRPVWIPHAARPCVAQPVLLVPPRAEAEDAAPPRPRAAAVLLLDPDTLDELARVVLPELPSWWWAGCWVPGGEDGERSPAGESGEWGGLVKAHSPREEMARAFEEEERRRGSRGFDGEEDEGEDGKGEGGGEGDGKGVEGAGTVGAAPAPAEPHPAQDPPADATPGSGDSSSAADHDAPEAPDAGTPPPASNWTSEQPSGATTPPSRSSSPDGNWTSEGSTPVTAINAQPTAQRDELSEGFRTPDSEAAENAAGTGDNGAETVEEESPVTGGSVPQPPGAV